MALGAGAVWSFGAIAARKADGADTFQYLIWRSVGVIVVIEILGRLQGKPPQVVRAFTSGWLMMTANAMLLLASIGFVYAVKTTSAANAAFLGSTTPVFGVLLARVVLKERLTRATIAAVFVAFIGLVIMVAGDLGAGSMIGNMSALMAAVGFAGYTVCVRSDPQEDWSSVLPGYAVMMIVICVATTLAHGKPLVPPAVDLGYALIHGGVFIVLGTILFNASSRRVPAGTMTVLAQTEMVLVPVWSFLLLGERPKTSTLVGGLIILGAIMTKAIIDARGPDAQPAEALEYIL
jgi:drug/metabolite transporter, DME family